MPLSISKVIRFVAVAENLSFTRAAQILRIDQPWLSRQIIQLEEQLGVSLFDRTGSRITLTAEGAEFYKTAKEVDKAYESARIKAEEMKRRTLSALRIGASNSTYGMAGRNHLLSRYNTLHRNVRVELSAFAFSDEIETKIVLGELDFGITFSRLDTPNLEAIAIEDAETNLCLPKNDPLAKPTNVMLSDLKERRIAVGFPDACTPRYKRIYSWLSEVGAIPVFVPEGRRFIFTVAKKEGLLVVSHSVADHIPDGFVWRPLQDPTPEYEVCLVRSKKRTMSAAGERFWRIGQELNVRLRELRSKGKTLRRAPSANGDKVSSRGGH
jgi:DNA-binding transcriptional LysR family regulator